jgi:hypothetical protein
VGESGFKRPASGSDQPTNEAIEHIHSEGSLFTTPSLAASFTLGSGGSASMFARSASQTAPAVVFTGIAPSKTWPDVAISTKSDSGTLAQPYEDSMAIMLPCGCASHSAPDFIGRGTKDLVFVPYRESWVESEVTKIDEFQTITIPSRMSCLQS